MALRKAVVVGVLRAASAALWAGGLCAVCLLPGDVISALHSGTWLAPLVACGRLLTGMLAVIGAMTGTWLVRQFVHMLLVEGPALPEDIITFP